MKIMIMTLTMLASYAAFSIEPQEYTCVSSSPKVRISFRNGLSNWTLPQLAQIKVEGINKPLNAIQEGAHIAPGPDFPNDQNPGSYAELFVEGSIFRSVKLDGEFKLLVFHERNQGQNIITGKLDLSSKEHRLNLKELLVTCTVNGVE